MRVTFYQPGERWTNIDELVAYLAWIVWALGLNEDDDDD